MQNSLVAQVDCGMICAGTGIATQNNIAGLDISFDLLKAIFR